MRLLDFDVTKTGIEVKHYVLLGVLVSMVLDLLSNLALLKFLKCVTLH